MNKHILRGLLVAGLAVMATTPAAAGEPSTVASAYEVSMDPNALDSTPSHVSQYDMWNLPEIRGVKLRGDVDVGVEAYSGSALWINKMGLQTLNDALGSTAYAETMSFWAVNQKVIGPETGDKNLKYTFTVDGTFAPESDNESFNFVAAAFTGKALATFRTPGTPMDDMLLKTTGGDYSLWLNESPGFGELEDNYIPDSLVSLCGLATGCTGGAYDAKLVTSFDVPVGEDFFIIGYAFMNGMMDGKMNFLNTMKLDRISLDGAFSLVSDDGGALVRSADGSYKLASAVPEPSTWLTMILGLGFVGAAMRRRPKKAALPA